MDRHITYVCSLSSSLVGPSITGSALTSKATTQYKKVTSAYMTKESFTLFSKTILAYRSLSGRRPLTLITSNLSILIVSLSNHADKHI